MKKSCDFCYRRKIKCGGQKPRCSPCVAYHNADCTYTAPSRKSRPKKRQSYAQIESDVGNTQDRLRHLEALFEQLTERVKVAEQHNKTETQTQPQLREERSIDIATLSAITTSESEPVDRDDDPFKSMFLPPLEQVLPVVDIFLQKFNAVLPLFHDETLLRLIHDFYSLGLQQRDPVAWAAINVVLALAHRAGLVESADLESSVEYLNRAQSVLSTVVLGDTQLLNIQVLVGIVMLLQASHDLRPSLILIATTLRLAHQIGLHNRTSSAHLDPAHAGQRACVFWLAYILDKDLSMRSKQPSIQLDDDIDLDLPSTESAQNKVNHGCEIDDADIGPGCITTVDGTVKMNFFVTRIQLAVIEGGVYDYLFSTRSQKRSSEERSRALESVACALDRWKASIPPEFSVSMALGRVPACMLRFVGILHATSLACTTLLNQATAWNAQWVGSIRKSAREGTRPALPPQWEALVDEARDLLSFFMALPVPDRWNWW